MPYKMTNPYKFTFNSSILEDGIVLKTDRFTEIGRYTVKAGEGVSLGYGAIVSQTDALGRIWGIIQKAGPAEIPGYVRIEIHDEKDRVIVTAWEGRTEKLKSTGAAALPSSMEVFSEMREIVSQDKSIVIMMKGDAADTVSKAVCSFLMDATNYDARLM